MQPRSLASIFFAFSLFILSTHLKVKAQEDDDIIISENIKQPFDQKAMRRFPDISFSLSAGPDFPIADYKKFIFSSVNLPARFNTGVALKLNFNIVLYKYLQSSTSLHFNRHKSELRGIFEVIPFEDDGFTEIGATTGLILFSPSFHRLHFAVYAEIGIGQFYYAEKRIPESLLITGSQADITFHKSSDFSYLLATGTKLIYNINGTITLGTDLSFSASDYRISDITISSPSIVYSDSGEQNFFPLRLSLLLSLGIVF